MSRPSNDDSKVLELKDYPTPEERAEFVILQLEKFIREGRTIDEGMSFKKWQTMARAEIAITIAEAEKARSDSEVIGKWLVFVVAAAMITIGFWGAAVSLENVSYLIAGIICTGSGVVLMMATGYWRFQKWNNSRKAKERFWRLKRIKTLNKRIKRLELALEEEEECLEEAVRKRRVSI